jgi:NAD(P)-dependent dehydrogenase (short-subunit alcohol dehydrogenase family)
MTLAATQVVVVGGSSGIGLATAALAQQQGAHITIAGRSKDRLAQAQQALGDVRTVAADIAQAEAVASIFAALERVDHVIISAGTLANGRIVDNNLETLRRLVDERLWGLVHVVRQARPRMTEGSITFTSGGLSSRPRLGTAMLTALLAAVEALAPALALELAPVRVNVVTPGLIDTPLLDGAFGSDRQSLIAARAAILPGKRVGTPEEVAQAIVMCMTNAYLNGAVLHIDGGGRYVS